MNARGRYRAVHHSHDRGSVTIFFLAVMSGIILVIGLVVDGSRAASATGRADAFAQEAARAAAQQITYASALNGGGPALDVATATAAAQQYLTAAGVSGTVKINSPTQVTVSTTLLAPTAFLGIVGINTITVHGTGTATVTPVT